MFELWGLAGLAASCVSGIGTSSGHKKWDLTSHSPTGPVLVNYIYLACAAKLRRLAYGQLPN
jgi:hypothetical protein